MTKPVQWVARAGVCLTDVYGTLEEGLQRRTSQYNSLRACPGMQQDSEDRLMRIMSATHSLKGALTAKAGF